VGLAALRGRLVVRVVTGQARERLGPLITAAEVRLLDVADHAHGAVRLLEAVVLAEVLQRQARTEVGEAPPSAEDGGAAAEVTLAAHRLGQVARQAGGVDDRVIDAAAVALHLVAFDVQRAGAVAALAADGRLRDLHAVQAAADGLYHAGMTGQTALAGGPLE